MLPTNCSKQDNYVSPSRGKKTGLSATYENQPTSADFFGIIGGTLKDRILLANPQMARINAFGRIKIVLSRPVLQSVLSSPTVSDRFWNTSNLPPKTLIFHQLDVSKPRSIIYIPKLSYPHEFWYTVEHEQDNPDRICPSLYG